MIIGIENECGCTLYANKVKGGAIFRGTSAAKAAAVMQQEPDYEEGDRRSQLYTISDRAFDIFCSKAVASGYRLALKL